MRRLNSHQFSRMPQNTFFRGQTHFCLDIAPFDVYADGFLIMLLTIIMIKSYCDSFRYSRKYLKEYLYISMFFPTIFTKGGRGDYVRDRALFCAPVRSIIPSLMVCAPVRRDNSGALARGLSTVQVHKPCSISLVP